MEQLCGRLNTVEVRIRILDNILGAITEDVVQRYRDILIKMTRQNN